MRLIEDLEARLAKEESLFRGDARTAELGEPLERLLEAVYAFEKGSRDAAQENCVIACWHELHRVRMERLLGCLATPVPKPVD